MSLAPCPFCGADERNQVHNFHSMIARDGTFFLECYACGAYGPPRETVELAEAAWSRQPGRDEARAERDECWERFGPCRERVYMKEAALYKHERDEARAELAALRSTIDLALTMVAHDEIDVADALEKIAKAYDEGEFDHRTFYARKRLTFPPEPLAIEGADAEVVRANLGPKEGE